MWTATFNRQVATGTWPHASAWLKKVMTTTMVESFIFGDPNLGAVLVDALEQLKSATPEQPWAPSIPDAPRAPEFINLKPQPSKAP